MENKQTFYIAIADKKIQVGHKYAMVAEKCRDYMTEGSTCDFAAEIDEEDLKKEFEKSRTATCGKHTDIINNQGYLETLAVHRKIADKMINCDIILMHGAAIAAHNRAIVFLAKSGIGKTTHIRNWIKTIPNVKIINGDKPLIDINTLKVYGSPWAGKENYNTNMSAKLGALCLLERSADNRICKIEFSDALKTIIEQVYLPDDMTRRVELIRKLERFKDIPCYRLGCNEDASSAITSHDAICSEWE